VTAGRERSRRPLPIVLIAVAVAAAAVGVALGAWVNWTWPNPVYGMQVIVPGAALVVAVLGVLAWGRVPFGRVFGTSSVALLVGIIGGIAFGPTVPEHGTLGTVTLRLERPIDFVHTGEAICDAAGGAGVSLSTGPVSVEGKRVHLVVQVYPQENERLGDPAGIPEVSIRVEAETGVAGTEYSATSDSIVEGSRGAASGSLRFAELAASPYGGGAPSPLDRDLAGTVEWRCTRMDAGDD
jgi:hypothetical protein